MTLEQAQAEFQAATEAYAAAKRGVSDQRFAARHLMPNTLAFAEMAEYTAYHRWLRAYGNVVALQPTPTPKPTVAPKPVVVSSKPAPVAPAKAAPSFAEAKREADLARTAYQAAMRRQDEAHERAVAAYQARPVAPLSQRKI